MPEPRRIYPDGAIASNIVGFVGIDAGPLEYSRTLDGATDFLRFQIVKMKLGVFATLSIDVLPGP